MTYQSHKSEESIEDYLETILILSRRLAKRAGDRQQIDPQPPAGQCALH